MSDYASSVCSLRSEEPGNLDLFGLFLDYNFSAKAAYTAASRLGINFVENAEDLMMLSSVQLKRLFPEIGLFNRVKNLIDVERAHQDALASLRYGTTPSGDIRAQAQAPLPQHSPGGRNAFEFNNPIADIGAGGLDFGAVLWSDALHSASTTSGSVTEEESEPVRFAYNTSEARNAFKTANEQALEPEAAKWMGHERAKQVIQSVSFLKQTNKALAAK